MALIVITISDNAASDCDIGVVSEPKLDITTMPVDAVLTAAQETALNMLHAAVKKVTSQSGLGQIIDASNDAKH